LHDTRLDIDQVGKIEFIFLTLFYD
jgi:hypothetical protein